MLIYNFEFFANGPDSRNQTHAQYRRSDLKHKKMILFAKKNKQEKNNRDSVNGKFKVFLPRFSLMFAFKTNRLQK